MADVEVSKKRFPRWHSVWTAGEVLAKVFDQWSGMLATRPYRKGNVSYLEEKSSPKFTRTVATGALPEAAPAGGPEALAGCFDLQAFADAVFYWKNDTATHTAMTVEFWVLADTGDWLLLGGQTFSVGDPLVEHIVEGVGHRFLFARVVGAGGGAAGDVKLFMAGN